jgi:hypothetical protein
LFKKLLFDKILAGEKTQTRRPIERKPGRRVCEVGEKVGVRLGYTKPSAFIIIKRRRRQKLGDITDEEAKKEGFKDLESFRKGWIQIYGNWNPQQVVWVYEFELAKKDSASKDKLFPLAAVLPELR